MEGLVERATLGDGGGWVGGDGLFGVNTMTPRWALIPHQWRPALGRLLRVEVLACDPPPLPPLALIFSRGSGIYACLFRTHCARRWTSWQPRAINRSGDGEVQYLTGTVPHVDGDRLRRVLDRGEVQLPLQLPSLCVRTLAPSLWGVEEVKPRCRRQRRSMEGGSEGKGMRKKEGSGGARRSGGGG